MLSDNNPIAAGNGASHAAKKSTSFGSVWIFPEAIAPTHMPSVSGVMVLAIAVGFLVRIGLSDGFRTYELPALGAIAFLLMFYPLFGAPTGFGATLIVAALIARRCLVPRTRVAASMTPINIGQFQT